jgi:hypothetical protein
MSKLAYALSAAVFAAGIAIGTGAPVQAQTQLAQFMNMGGQESQSIRRNQEKLKKEKEEKEAEEKAAQEKARKAAENDKK